MAYITLPSGKRIDTSHISYMTHHEHTIEPIWPATTGAIHRRRTLHMDNNDEIHLNGPDIDALDAAMATEQGPGGAGSVIVDNPDTNPIPINVPAGSSLSTIVDNPDTNPVPINVPVGSSIPTTVSSAITTWAVQTTTDANAVLGTPWNKTGLKTTTVVIHNTGTTNAATVTVEGSVDGTNWDFTIFAGTSTAAGARQVVRFADYFTHIRILIRATTAGAQTTVVARAAAIAT